MKVKALVDFGGQYAMQKGTETDLPDNPVTRSLILGGFIMEVEAPAPAVEEPVKDEEESSEVLLSGLSKSELMKMCKEKGVKVDKKAKKEDLIAALEA